MRETRVRSLGREDLLEKDMATHPSILAWRIPWMEDLGRLQSMGSQRVGLDWATSLSLSPTAFQKAPPGQKLLGKCRAPHLLCFSSHKDYNSASHIQCLKQFLKYFTWIYSWLLWESEFHTCHFVIVRSRSSWLFIHLCLSHHHLSLVDSEIVEHRDHSFLSLYYSVGPR